jgi:iron-sulfur cluster assembly protein
MITLTDSAVGAVRRFIESAEKPVVGLRIKVEGGGCSGMKYGMKLEDSVEQDDAVVDFPGIKVLIDATSAPLLDSVTVDFIDGLEGTGFKFENPNASASCGCGKSFSC